MRRKAPEFNRPPPVPIKVEVQPRRSVTNNPKNARASANARRERDIRAITRKHQIELARAVANVHAQSREDAAMQERIYASQPTPMQSHRRRLRKAVYFEDDSSDEDTTQIPAHLTKHLNISTDSSVDRDVWTEEPKSKRAEHAHADVVEGDSMRAGSNSQSNSSEIIKQLQRQVQESKEENARLREQMERIMTRLENALPTLPSDKDGAGAGKGAEQPNPSTVDDRLVSTNTRFEREVGSAQRDPGGRQVGQAEHASPEPVRTRTPVAVPENVSAQRSITPRTPTATESNDLPVTSIGPPVTTLPEPINDAASVSTMSSSLSWT